MNLSMQSAYGDAERDFFFFFVFFFIYNFYPALSSAEVPL